MAQTPRVFKSSHVLQHVPWLWHRRGCLHRICDRGQLQEQVSSGRAESLRTPLSRMCFVLGSFTFDKVQVRCLEAVVRKYCL